MESIWGLSVPYVKYSEKGFKLFTVMVDGEKKIFQEEFGKSEGDDIVFGSRFKNNDKIFHALQSNVSEEDFIKAPQYYLFKVLMGACETDYYYLYEKMW